ncbi:MAG TPA: hypothetical protein VE439_05535 [Anaerolineae bacterium]|nr:hypothetical protein [Anaerolineae bacterium]
MAMFLRVPIAIQQRALQVGILTGIINIAADAIGLSLNLWHYNLSNLIFGFPLDIYITVAIVFGGVALMIFWWIRQHQPRWILPFLIFLPIYGLARDYTWSRLTDAVIAFDSPYWWIGDILAWMVVFWIPIYVFNRTTNQGGKAT